MENFDSFDEFLNENKEAFSSEEPSFGHFNRFADKLGQIHEQQPKKKNKTMIYAAACAIALLATAIAFPFINRSNTSITAQQEQPQPRSADFNEQLKTSTLQAVNSPAIQANYSTDADFEQMLEEITKLEMEYVQLKQYYNSRNHCEKVLAKMEENLETRLSILKKINSREDSLEILRFVHQEFMLNQKTDCFGFLLDSETDSYFRNQNSFIALAH